MGFILLSGMAVQIWQSEVDISPVSQANRTIESDDVAERVKRKWTGVDDNAIGQILAAPLFAKGRVMPDSRPGAAAISKEIQVTITEKEEKPPPKVKPVAKKVVSEPPTPPAPPPISFRLVGVMIVGDQREILLFDEKTQEKTWIAMSEKISGWTVSKIEKDNATLRFDGLFRRFELYPE